MIKHEEEATNSKIECQFDRVIVDKLIAAYHGDGFQLRRAYKERVEKTNFGIESPDCCKEMIEWCIGIGEYGVASYLSVILLEQDEDNGKKYLIKLAPNNSFCSYNCAVHLFRIGDIAEGEKWLKGSSNNGNIYAKRLIDFRNGNLGKFRSLRYKLQLILNISKDVTDSRVKEII